MPQVITFNCYAVQVFFTYLDIVIRPN